MNPVAKALWFIESHPAEEVTLADISAVAGVSRFHLVRAFGVTTGYSVMRYVRARRLGEAARALANGAPDILMLALDAGYSSHEAFTRAFRDQFGLTPDMVRARGSVDTLLLVKAIMMDQAIKTTLPAPRLEHGRILLIAGLSERFSVDDPSGIPALWRRFREHLGHVPDQLGSVTYGVSYNQDDTGCFDYIAGVEVAGFAALSKDMAGLRITEHQYAVFTHSDHVAAIRRTYTAIFNDWLPQSGHQLADAPLFERMDEQFDPRTGTGGIEIWVPFRS